MIKARIAVVKLLSQQKRIVILPRVVVLEMKRKGQIRDTLGIQSQGDLLMDGVWEVTERISQE